MSKCYLIYNSKAGDGQCKEVAEKYSKTHLEKECVLMDSFGIVSFEELLKSIEEDSSVIICGGDGTLNYFINHVNADDIKQDIYSLAGGTGNDFLKDVGANTDEPFLINKYIKNLPTVVVNGKTYKFLNNVGFGIDGYCCEVGDALKAKGEKNINYGSIAIKGLLGGFKTVNATVIVDGVEKKYKHVWLAPTMKGRYYGGGMIAAPNQDRLNEDGLLTVMIMHNWSKIKTLIVFPSIFKGEHIKHKNMVECITGKNIKVIFDKPTAIQIDGETIIGQIEYEAKA